MSKTVLNAAQIAAPKLCWGADMRNLGATVLREVLTSGGDIGAHLNTLFNAPRNQTTADMLGGAVFQLMRIYEAVRAVGHVGRYEDKELDAFMHGTPNAMDAALLMNVNPTDANWVSKYLGEVVNVVQNCREKITFTPVEPTPTEQTPLSVHIVSMPDRVIESKVNYDAKGNITSTTQTEKTAAA